MVVSDLLKRMADVYAGAKTYADRGRARRLYITPSSRTEDRERFWTFLDRDRGFRFAGSSDRTPFIWTPDRPGQMDPQLMSFLVRRFTIPTATLLLPGQFGRNLLDELRDAEYQGSQTLRSGRCHRILARWRKDSRITLWMDEEHYLLRRAVDRTEYPHARDAAELRNAHLERRDRALAAGISRKLVEQEFGADHLLAVRHWPYTTPREDARAITTVAYVPTLNVPVDPQLFRRRA